MSDADAPNRKRPSVKCGSEQANGGDTDVEVDRLQATMTKHPRGPRPELAAPRTVLTQSSCRADFARPSIDIDAFGPGCRPPRLRVLLECLGGLSCSSRSTGAFISEDVPEHLYPLPWSSRAADALTSNRPSPHSPRSSSSSVAYSVPIQLAQDPSTPLSGPVRLEVPPRTLGVSTSTALTTSPVASYHWIAWRRS